MGPMSILTGQLNIYCQTKNVYCFSTLYVHVKWIQAVPKQHERSVDDKYTIRQTNSL